MNYDFLKDENVKAIAMPIKILQGESKGNNVQLSIETLDIKPFNSIEKAEKHIKKTHNKNMFGIVIKVNEDGSLEF